MRRVLIGGFLGGAVMIVWFMIADGFLGFKRSIDMNQLSDEREVYAFLDGHVTEPGRYVCNPELLPEQRYPEDTPVFAVQYSGLGHGDAGQEMILGLVVAVMACIAGAWILANASNRILLRYGSRVVFFAMVGVVVALLGIGARFGVSAYSLSDAFALAVHDAVGWLAAGLAVASIVKPPVERATTIAS